MSQKGKKKLGEPPNRKSGVALPIGSGAPYSPD
jgi:hypothetical protein